MAHKFCPNCGTPNPNGFAFCPNCGTPLGDSTPASSAPTRPTGSFGSFSQGPSSTPLSEFETDHYGTKLVAKRYKGQSETVIVPKEFALVNGRCFAGTRVRKVILHSGIEDARFYENTVLETVEFAEGTTVLKDNAFYHCTALASVKLPSTLRVIEKMAFDGTSSLSNIILPEGLESIGENAFNGAGIREIRLPDSVVSIGGHCFESAKRLERVTISRNVEVIPMFAFDECPNLRSVIFAPGSRLKRVEKAGFYYCTSLQALEMPSSFSSFEESSLGNTRNLRSIRTPYGSRPSELAFKYYDFDRDCWANSYSSSINITLY